MIKPNWLVINIYLLLLNYFKIILCNELCTYYPNYPDQTTYKVVDCSQKCCENKTPKTAQEACCSTSYSTYALISIILPIIGFMICSTLICVVVMCLGRRSKANRRARQPATTAFIITPNSYPLHSNLNNNIMFDNSTSDNNFPPPPPYAAVASNENQISTVEPENQQNNESNERKSLEPPKYEMTIR